VPANVAGGFVLGPIMFLGMLSLLLGFVSTWLSVPLNLVAGLFVGFLIEVARVFGRLPWAVYEWGGVSLPLVLAAALVLQLAAVRLLAVRAGIGLVAYVKASTRRAPLVAATACVVAAALLLAPAPPSAPGTVAVTFLDVGEGAATLLQVPRGPTVLVDAGPEPVARQLREHGVRRIDLLVLSHGHDDHVAGLEDVVGRLAIGTALLPLPEAPSEALDALEVRLRASGAEVRRVTQPVTLAGDGWGLRVLPSAPAPGSSGNQAENDAALVAVVELGPGRVLLPGDAEGAALSALDLPRCAVVALPHHGSSGGLDAALLERLAPSLAVVPVGPNSYGHPSVEMLELLTGAGVPYVRTDERGDTTVWVGDGELRVSVAGGG
jgi:competence protein ComEC